MKSLCSLWLCLGSKAEVKVVEQEDTPSGKNKEIGFVADGNVEVKRSDGGKQRVSANNYLEDRDTAAWRVAASEIVKNCEAGAGKPFLVTEKPALQERQSFLAGDLHNERTLRAILQKAKVRLSEQTQAFAPEPQINGPLADSGRAGFASDPELVRLNAQLLETCSVPRPDARALLRLENLLGEVRCWLAARPCPAAATVVLYTVGDGLVHAEHAIRSVGLVRYWQPNNTSVFLALLQLYSDLLIQAARAAQLQRQQQKNKEQQRMDQAGQKPPQSQQQQQEQQQQQTREKGEEQQQQQQSQQPSSDSDVVVLAADKEQQLQQKHQNHRNRLLTEKLLPQLSEMSLEYSEQGPSCPQRNLPSGHQQVPLTFAAAALLLRPDWLDMLAEVLELLHFSEEYRLAAARAGKEPQEALAKALQLWCFLTQLVKFAAAHAHSVQRMEPCLQRLNALLAPPSGTVPRLLDLPLAEDTLVAQLHALWLLQVLYDMPDAKLLYSSPLAEYYVALHHNAMVQSYEASAADPKSAAAELCRIHATLLRSMARHPGAAVRSTFARMKTVEWILQELSLESQLLAAAQQGGVADDQDTSSDSANDSDVTESDDDEDEDGNEEGDGDEVAEAVGEVQSRSDKLRPLSPAVSVGGSTAAEEAEKGREEGATGPGADSRKASKGFSFTYDLNEDVERLIALEDELGQEMELDGFEYDEEGKQLKARSDARLAEAQAAAATVAAASMEQPTLSTPAGAGNSHSYGSFGSTSRRSGGIPRLALSSLRTASISSMAAHSPMGKRSSGHGPRTSHTGNSPLFVREEGDEGEEPLSDDARTPSPNAATAAERVAVWSSSLMDAYAAASAGDDSKLPYPPPRSRSTGSGSFGVVGPAGLQTPSGVGSEQFQHQKPPRAMSGEDRAAITTSATPDTPVAAADEPTVARPREITNGSPIHAGPQGELHLLVQSSGTVRATQPSSTPAGHGRPPLPTKPALPPLKMGSMDSGTAAAAAAPPSTVTPPSPSVSARAPQAGSSRAMMVLSASNRMNMVASSPTGTQQQQQQAQPVPSPWAHTTTAPMSSSPVRELTRQCHAGNDGSAPAVSQQQPQPASVSTVGSSPGRPPQPLIPALNLKSLRRRDGGAIAPPTDTGRTVPLSSMLRFTNGGSVSNCSGRDSANTLLRSGGTATTPASSNATYHHSHAASNLGVTSGILHCITETEQRPPEVAYQEIACQRLLYQDRATHILLLKVLIDLLVAPWGALDPVYVPQYPAHCGAPHTEFILLWHLNAPRNAGVVHDLCRGAQRRAQQAATSAARRAAEVAMATGQPVPQPHGGSPQGLTHHQQPTDSARDYSPSSSIASFQPKLQQQPMVQAPAARTAGGASSPGAGAAAIVAAPTRAGAVTRALQLLSRPLFDPSRYTNLQFVARGTFGDIYRARMEPPRTQAWPSPTSPSEPSTSPPPGELLQPQMLPMQVVIKTIPLPSSPHDSCVLADVFGEVSVMERFVGNECICQLLDYGMRDDAYWLVMRRYRCSLAEWRGRQKPLDDLMAATGGAAAVAAATHMYLSALIQVVDALRLLASHHVVHFDLKCSNVLIEPLPGVRDGELWASVGSGSGGTATANGNNNNDNGHRVPFRCVLADFGEARAYRCAEEAFTARNRGTEVFKSPEMLMLNAASRTSMKPTYAAVSPLPMPPRTETTATTAPDSPPRGGSNPPSTAGTCATIPRSRNADAQRQGLAGAGLASDIWSLGCLAYELLSGTVLFGGDYASVTHRVAFGSGEQLTLTDSERVRLANLPELVGLVEWILARDPAMRPSLDQIRERIELIQSALGTA
ncbi:hypothetical protein Vretimale_10708 [Volvox reticuliferus]|uniref:Protein kinase domain-containing protein n=1 Tax=Volvox reticuliferus TaxID=1737510 RepID=A0A8J4CNI3_9CHLO|nr:hypothetical protein Vretifemale_13802 [Volvox reticuliferus]GIM06405.1 hypothetical protein Vretimale_10708 [Volvox reticuliferus]